MKVDVAYASSEQQWLISLDVPDGATAKQAIEKSGILTHCAQPIDALSVGIFSRKATLEQTLREGDRVEIYRPLLIDPKEARRRRG